MNESEVSMKEIKKDDWAIVLDFLEHGHYGMSRPEPVAQVLGEKYFSLLEVILREDQRTGVGERIYIGDQKREKVKYIRERITPDKLTASAKEELQEIIDKIIMQQQQQFIDFFNKAGQLTTRMHMLELLPGIGKKHLWAILDARKEKPFESFADVKKRVSLLPDPEKMIVKRVMLELADGDKYRIFVPKFEKQQHEDRYH
ncbi:MAG: DUF655 domain-containing protein [Candidatus Aenigmarchaeota archaeon]|nr:DUF655 domain-containing protein [Candidatus Aenigmarchaeota archaeon]